MSIVDWILGRDRVMRALEADIELQLALERRQGKRVDYDALRSQLHYLAEDVKAKAQSLRSDPPPPDESQRTTTTP